MTRAEAKSETARCLLNAARELFERKGWSRVSAREVGEQARRPFQAIYDHFGSMEALWREAMSCEPPDPVAFAAFMADQHPQDFAPEVFRSRWMGSEP